MSHKINIKIKKVLIVGLGLIGSSLCRDLKKNSSYEKIYGYDIDEDVMQYALNSNYVHGIKKNLKEGIEDSIKQFDYIRSLPVRSKYELSLCSDEIYLENGFDKPIIQQITNSYSKILTTRELEALRKQYPKPKPEYWKGGRGSSNTKVLSSTNNSITQSETQHQSGSALMPNQGEAFEIPANDGLFVIHQDSTDIEHESIQPS